MKKFFIVAFSIVIIILFLVVNIKPSTIQKEYNGASEIKKLYKLEGNALIRTVKDDPRDRIEVTIGNKSKPQSLLDRLFKANAASENSGFTPQVKISRWDDEVNLALVPKMLDSVPQEDRALSFDGDKVIYDTPKVEYNLYNIASSSAIPEGAFEYEVILKEKPITNVVEFNIQTNGLSFYLQRPYTEEYRSGYSEEFKRDIVVSATQVKDLKGDVLRERPENVIGSYAVYSSEEKVNYVGGKEYKVGKVGHIYRPKIFDSTGKSVWGDLKIDVQKGILSVTIPQEFIDTAAYPIRHAAGLTFGYTSTGNSDFGNVAGESSDYSASQGMAATLNDNALLDSLHAALRLNAAGTENIDVYMALYDKDSAGSESHGKVSGTGVERLNVAFNTTIQFYTFTESQQALSPDTYVIGVMGNGEDIVATGQRLKMLYDSIGQSTSLYEEYTYGAGSYSTRKAEDPWTETAFVGDYHLGLYATYSLAPTPTPTPTPMPILNVGTGGGSETWYNSDQWGFRKSFTLSHASGALTNYQMKMYVNKTNASAVINNADATTSWAVNAGSIATDTGDKHEGTASLKITASGGDPFAAYDPASTWDWSSKKTITFWAKTDTANKSCNSYLINTGYSAYSRWDFTFTTSWAMYTIDLGNPAATTNVLDATKIDYFRIGCPSGVAGEHFWIDDMNVLSSGSDGKSLDGSGSVYAGSRVQDNFNDLRFTTSNGTTPLDYWIESYVSGTSAVVWVEFDSIGTGATTFYMYYGNANAATYSNATNTYVFYDDFSGSTLDTNKWQIVSQTDPGATYTVSGGLLTVYDPKANNGTAGYLTSLTTFSGPVRISVYRKANANSGEKSVKVGGATYSIYHIDSNDCITSEFDTVTHCWITDISPRTDDGTNWFKIEVIYIPGTSSSLYINDTFKKTLSVSFPDNYSYALYNWSPSWKSVDAYTYFDWVIARKYDSTDPAWGTWGATENSPSSTMNFDGINFQ